MKLKNRRDDASAPGTDEWAKMNDWFAELRDDPPGPAEPARDGLADDGPAEPARHSPAEPARHSPAEPARHGGRHRGPATDVAPPAGRPAPDAGVSARVEVVSRVEKPQRAPIGDQLRRPAAWCEMGSCIERHADPEALGEADARARAISAGWRVDALGRLACPRCQQTSSGFRASCPVTLWDRDTALASATLTIAVTRHRRAASNPGRPAAGVIPAGPPAAVSRQHAPGVAPETSWPPPCPPAGRPAQ